MVVTPNWQHGVILDKGSLGSDIDYSALTSQLAHWQSYAHTRGDEVAERISHAEVVITNKVQLTEPVLRQASSLKLICVAATGTNNVDLNACRALGIQVCNVAGYATPSVVEHTFALMLTLMRNLRAYDHDLAAGAWQGSPHFCLLDHPISELCGKQLGIIGYGELGKAVAQVARAFGMEVLVAKSLRNGSAVKEEGRVELDELLSTVDILTLHCPLTDKTRHLIDRQKLSLMKCSALLINTARGNIVDETALCDALLSEQIAGAAIDVLSVEPPQAGNPLLDLRLPNLIITPHIAWASKESRQRLLNEIAANIQAFKHGGMRNSVV